MLAMQSMTDEMLLLNGEYSVVSSLPGRLWSTNLSLGGLNLLEVVLAPTK
jgi:hypothetical protein